ncbi:MAG: HAMP domain-containing sensor histidine kinase [Chloroflexota bacterium]
MPDGMLPPTETTAPEPAAEASEGRMVRHVRRNLVLWSGGTTLVILLLLAVTLYVAVASSLASTATNQLDSRFDQVKSSLTGQRPDPDDQGPYGFLFGGGGGGTIALAVDDANNVLAPRGFHVPAGLPDMDAVAGARAHGRDVRTESLSAPAFGPNGSATTVQTPVRILTENVQAASGQTFAVQVVGDRIAEQRTLDVMLVVLVIGGLVVVLVAFGFGTIYARRALVPIRESLANQRVALRRQREFAADASHELRTPLTVIRSSVEHLERHRDEPVASVGSALEDIDDEVRHMTAIVEDLLLLARSDSGAIALEHVPVDLGDVAADGASAMGKPATDRGIRVEVDPQPAVVAGDPARLRQLVMILVDNAIRHSPTDGRVGVAVRAVGSGASLVVEDDGPGIRPEDLPHLFERFYRAPGAPGGGTGLGLAIAKWIVDRHGGHIEVVNRPEGGARFVVSLPATGGVAA